MKGDNINEHRKVKMGLVKTWWVQFQYWRQGDCLKSKSCCLEDSGRCLILAYRCLLLSSLCPARTLPFAFFWCATVWWEIFNFFHFSEIIFILCHIYLFVSKNVKAVVLVFFFFLRHHSFLKRLLNCQNLIPTLDHLSFLSIWWIAGAWYTLMKWLWKIWSKWENHFY